MARIRASTSASSGLVTRSVLFSTMTSAKAIWFLASGASFSRSDSHLASATVTTASRRAFFCTSSSTKKVWATGAGSARPVVSTMMASNLPLRFIRPSMMRTRSPRTVQQRGLAGAEIAGQDGHGNFGGGRFRHNNSGVGLPREAGWPPALVVKRAGQGLYIVPDHINVSGGKPLFARQTVRNQGPADLCPGLGRDPPDQAVVADILQEDGRDFLGPDLADDAGDVPGAGLGFGGEPQGRDELDAVFGGEIAEGVVGGDHLAPLGRDLGDGLTYLAVERFELFQIGFGLGTEEIRISRVGRSERIGDVSHINFRVGDGLTGMGIGGRAELVRCDARARGHDRGLAAGGLHQPRQPALEAEPVDDDKLCVRNALRIAWCGRVDVDVTVGADQRRDVDPIAANGADEIAEDREAHNDVEPLRGVQRRGDQQERTKQDTPHRHASRCRPGNSCRTMPPTRPNSTETM